MTPQLEKKVEQSIKLLRSIPQDKGDIILAYSGGKDSDVVLDHYAEVLETLGEKDLAVYYRSLAQQKRQK